MNYQTMTREEFDDLDASSSMINYRAFRDACRRAHHEYPHQSAEEITEGIYNDGDAQDGCKNYGIDWEQCLIDAAYQLGFEAGVKSATLVARE